jgi:hypothetical protein
VQQVVGLAEEQIGSHPGTFGSPAADLPGRPGA